MILNVLAGIAYYVLFAYFVALWTRLVLDLIRAYSPGWRPRAVVLVVSEVVYTVTDPPLRLVRRIIPPWRIGGFALDFGFTIVLVAVILLMNLASGLRQAGVA